MTAVALKESYIRLLRDCLLDNIYKNQKACDHDGTILRDATECEIQTGTVWPDRAHTMIGQLRMDNIIMKILYFSSFKFKAISLALNLKLYFYICVNAWL
jgi:hypothetical protein